MNTIKFIMKFFLILLFFIACVLFLHLGFLSFAWLCIVGIWILIGSWWFIYFAIESFVDKKFFRLFFGFIFWNLLGGGLVQWVVFYKVLIREYRVHPWDLGIGLG